MNINITTRAKRNAKARPAGLFDWAREAELLTLPAVRAIARRANVSPVLAFTIAELGGFVREGR